MNEQYLTHNIEKSKYLILLAMLYNVVFIVSGIFIYRFVDLGHGILLPGGMFIYPLIYVISDIVTETYGYKAGRLLFWYGYICNFFVILFSYIFIHLPTIPGSQVSNAYYQIFHDLYRVALANFIGQFVGSFINIYVISKWKIMVRGRFFFIRSILSNLFGEFIMLGISGVIILYGKLSLKQAIIFLLADYIVRVIFVTVCAGPASIFVNWMKKVKGIDVYDYGTNFNPFKLTLESNSEKLTQSELSLK